MKIELPDMNEDENMSPEKVRQKMKERGLMPPRPWMERPFYIASTGFNIKLCAMNKYHLYLNDALINYIIKIVLK